MGSQSQNAVTAQEFPTPTFPAGRYGRRREPGRSWRPVMVLLLIVVLAATVGVTLRLYTTYSADVIHNHVTAFTVVSDHEVHVQFTVQKDSDSAVTCSIRARARDGETVGQAEVVVPAHSPETTNYTLVTRKKAITGEVLRCVPGEHVERGSPALH
ncbi:MAG: DUF4307 domain-containing protein [Mycobacteriales bacterium]